MSEINLTDAKLEIVSAHGSFDLLNHLSELVIYENIFRPALTATLILRDAKNLPYKLPIVGEEVFNIDIGSKTFENKAIRIKPPPLHVNSIKDREIVKPKSQIIALELVSEKFMSDSHAKVSRSYKDKKISEIVTDIHNTYLDDGNDLYVEKTKNIERCIIPNMSPIDAIKWLSMRAIPDALNRNVNYLFYETISGSFFVSINSLLEIPPTFICMFKPRIEDSRDDTAIASQLIPIDTLTFRNTFNKYQNTKRGVYASKLITHDIVKKKIIQHENNYMVNWIQNNHLGKWPPLSGANVETKSASVNRTSFAPPKENFKPIVNENILGCMIDSRVEFYPKHDKMYCTWTGDSYDNKAEEWKLQRNSIGLFQNLNIYVEGPGVSSVRVGQLIHLKIPSTETTDGDKMSDVGFDKSLSGTFMITAIKHIFSRESTDGTYIEYRMGLELSKDGSEEKVPYRQSTNERFL